MAIERILLLEDDPVLRNDVQEQLRERGYAVETAGTLAALQDLLNAQSFDVIIADVRLPDGLGTDLLRQLESHPVKPLVVMISGFGSPESVVDSLRAGAFAYLLKPFSSEQLDVVLRKGEEHLQLLRLVQHLSFGDEADPWQALLGSSAAMEQLRKSIRAAARTQATVLVRGETGSGKTLVAHALHQQSPRAEGPFLTANCALLAANRLEAELFGSEKGGAAPGLGPREGRLELAHGGTILLDEISEIPLELQPRLLRLFQHKKLMRADGHRTVEVDVRVIATSSRPLEQQIKQKKFREDLFMALNLVPIAVPALRERPEDIPVLAEHFRERLVRRHGAKVLAMSPACLSALQSYDWPGNVAELRNVMELAVLLGREGSVLEPAHLRLGLHEPKASSGVEESAMADSESVLKVDTLDEIEKKHILAALEHCQGNRTRAAEALGISIRTLRNKLRQYRTEAAGESSESEAES